MSQLTDCPCGSKEPFKNCCQPFIQKTSNPITAEQLMRSRYSAYTIKDAQYIFDTYANKSQKEQSITDIKVWANEVNWLRLDVLEGNSTAHPDQVTFVALYLVENKLYSMSETSRFIIENEQWRYLDGELVEHKELSTIKRNDLCPCNSHKKYKKCCGK